MRDPKRINKFCEELKETWYRYPDFRFGQYMSNFLGYVVEKSGKDIWFIEEPEMQEYLVKFREDVLGG